MPKALTDTMLRAVSAPATGRVELTDARCRGLVFRVTDKGVKTFALRYKGARITLGNYPELSLMDARTLADMQRGVAQAPRPSQAITFDELAQRFIDEYSRPRKASWRGDVSNLKRPRAMWGRRQASSITDDDAALLLDAIAKIAPVGANRTQALLHKLFAWAKEPGRKYVRTNPLADMPRRARERPKERVLSQGELRTLWLGLGDQPIDRALKMILLTAARPGEVAGMSRGEIIGAEWHIPGVRTKNRRPHVVPLSDLALSLLPAEDIVFPSRYGARTSIARHSLSQALLEIIERLGLAPFTPHDLRRTAATLAREAGVPRDSVAALLNHTRGDVTGVYDKYDMLTEKRFAVETISRRIGNISRA